MAIKYEPLEGFDNLLGLIQVFCLQIDVLR